MRSNFYAACIAQTASYLTPSIGEAVSYLLNFFPNFKGLKDCRSQIILFMLEGVNRTSENRPPKKYLIQKLNDHNLNYISVQKKPSKIVVN